MDRYAIVSSPLHWQMGHGSEAKYIGNRKSCAACGVIVYRGIGADKDYSIRDSRRFCKDCIKHYDKIFRNRRRQKAGEP
jgi:hypothetical protein